MQPSETTFDVVDGPMSRGGDVVRVSVQAHALGSLDAPAGVAVLLDGCRTGVESFVAGWEPELTLVDTVRTDDVSRLTVKAIGDAVVLKAIAYPFGAAEATAESGTGTRQPPGRVRWAGPRALELPDGS